MPVPGVLQAPWQTLELRSILAKNSEAAVAEALGHGAEMWAVWDGENFCREREY